MPEDESTVDVQEEADLLIEGEPEAEQEQEQKPEPEQPAEPTPEQKAQWAREMGYVPKPEEKPVVPARSLESDAKQLLASEGKDPDDWDQLEEAKERVREYRTRQTAMEAAAQIAAPTIISSTRDELAATHGAETAQEFDALVSVVSPIAILDPATNRNLKALAIGNAILNGKKPAPETKTQRTVTQTTTTHTLSYANSAARAADEKMDARFGWEPGTAAKMRLEEQKR